MTDAPVADGPLASSLMAMTGASLDQCDLTDRDIMVARTAALAAVGASAWSYGFNAGAAAEAGLTLEDAQGILIAVAPIIGTARTISAADAITEGLGIAVALTEIEE